MSYIGVLGNTPISADRGPKGNASDRGTGGTIWENCRRFFSFFGCYASGLLARLIRIYLAVPLIRYLSNYLAINRDRLDVCLIVSIALATLC
jgi:hypothetical protein